MKNYNDYFTLYEATESPPIITEGYKVVKDNYQRYIIPQIFQDNQNTDNNDNMFQLKEEQKTEPFNIPIMQSTKPIVKQKENKTGNYIVDYFINKGLTKNQAKGIYGNIMQESGGNIEALSKDGHESYGIAQWTGPRKDKLFEMFGTNPSLDQQLDFLWWELNNTHKDTLTSLKRTTTISDATQVFMDKFERPNKKYANFARRLKYANSIV